MNSRSLVNKLSKFQAFAYSSNYNIFCVSETWLSNHIFDNEILPTGYSIYRKDRNSRGGGVLMAIKDNLTCNLMSSPPDIEIITVKISTSVPIFICLVYIPPNSSENYYDSFFHYLFELSNKASPIILVGDFNFPDIDWATYCGSSPISNKFCDLLFQLNLSQLISEPTHNQGNILDLVITSDEDIIQDIIIHPHDYQLVSSDHYTISFGVKLPANYQPTFTPQVIFDYTKANYIDLCNFLSSIDFSVCELLPDVDSIWNYIKDCITTGMHMFIPKIKLSSSQTPKWYTSNIRHQIKCLRTLRKKHKRHPTDHNLLQVQTAEKDLQNNIQLAKASFEAKLVQDFAFSNNPKIFQYIRNITKSTFIPSTVVYKNCSASLDIDRANLYNEYFYSVFSQSTYSLPPFSHMPSTSPSLNSINISEEEVYHALTNLDPNKAFGIDSISPALLKHCAVVLTKPLHYLFSYSIYHCCLPSEWKAHCIIPIFKSGDKTSVTNYRPISLLCVVSKVLEQIIYENVITSIHNQISSRQFGFMKGKSTLQQLLIFFNNIYENTKIQTDVIYLDFAKAFDRVPHNELLLKLWKIGITGDLWLWFNSYLTNRTQCVRLNGSYSSFLPVLSGVPQGSILGPLLFLVYINDLFSSIHCSNALSFADDTKCYKPILQLLDSFQLQQDLDSLSDWSRHWNLSFNFSKFIHLSFNLKFPTTYFINDNAITANNTHRDLGIILSTDLSWRHHYSHISAKAYKTLGLLRRAFSHAANTLTKKSLYLALVRSQLLYCSPLWHPYHLNDITLLERIQRRATKYILNDFTSNYKSRLINLNLFPLMYILDLYDILFFVKSIKNPSASFNIRNYVDFCQLSTRSSANNKLKHVFSSTNKQSNFYFKRLPRIYNALPPLDLKQSFITIKVYLKQFLWNHFVTNFTSDNPHSLHFVCPCSLCSKHPCTPNFSSFN